MGLLKAIVGGTVGLVVGTMTCTPITGLIGGAFIAQDWENDFAPIVNKDDEGLLGMKYTETIPVLLKAIQEQQKMMIENLQVRNDSINQARSMAQKESPMAAMNRRIIILTILALVIFTETRSPI